MGEEVVVAAEEAAAENEAVVAVKEVAAGRAAEDIVSRTTFGQKPRYKTAGSARGPLCRHSFWKP